MKIESVFSSEFRKYGMVLEDYDFGEFIRVLGKTSCPGDGVIYEPSCPELECLPVAEKLKRHFYGDMPVQIGYCNGHNGRLDCLEYHRDSEINVFATDAVLVVSTRSELENWKLDTEKVRAFRVPAGMAVELYATTLHYAPCGVDEDHDFRVSIILPRGTNTEMPKLTSQTPEDRLLWARNKWLIAHPDAPEASQGAYVGLTGRNLQLW